MEAAGINVERIGECAWSVIEPEEGKYILSLFVKEIGWLHEKERASTSSCAYRCRHRLSESSLHLKFFIMEMQSRRQSIRENGRHTTPYA